MGVYFWRFPGKKMDLVRTRMIVSSLAIVIYRVHLPAITFAVLKRNVLEG